LSELSLHPHGDSKALSPKREMNRLLSLSMLFSCLLVAVRIAHTGRLTFIFLIWNLLLAYIPYFITAYANPFRHEDDRTNPFRHLDGRAGSPWHKSFGGKLRFGLFFGCWLLFIPNAFYIFTDLFHLNDRFTNRLVPQWYDLVLILSFAWNGLLLGVLSVRQMEHLLAPILPKRQKLLFLYPIMWLNALGVYIGRYLRYNSWDVVTSPLDLFRDIAAMVIHPLRHQYAWDMILCFSTLLTLIYLILRKIGD